MNRSTKAAPTSLAASPFQQLQKILDKQQTRPIRASPIRQAQAPTSQQLTGVVLNRKKVEEQDVTSKRMFNEKLQERGQTWQDMIQRTSDERVINQRVNISEARAFFPDTKRCLHPEMNDEAEPQIQKKVPQSETQKVRLRNDNLLAGQSTSALDERVKNKKNWKVGLINKYENNQQAWGQLTNSFVNKLKEEVKYDPQQDFVWEQPVVDEKLARKLDIMQEQCRMHKENMQNNPITGNRSETPRASGRRQSGIGLFTGKSDIHNFSKGIGVEGESATPSLSGKRKFEQKIGEGPIPRDPHSPIRPSYSRQEPTQAGENRRANREAYAEKQGMGRSVQVANDRDDLVSVTASSVMTGVSSYRPSYRPNTSLSPMNELKRRL